MNKTDLIFLGLVVLITFFNSVKFYNWGWFLQSSTVSHCQLLNKTTEFEAAVRRVLSDVRLDNDIVVSVFETNIRVLGWDWTGLLTQNFCYEIPHVISQIFVILLFTHWSIHTRMKTSVVVLHLNLNVCLIFVCACLQRSFRRALYGCDAEGGRSTHAVVPGWAPAYGQRPGPPPAASV